MGNGRSPIRTTLQRANRRQSGQAMTEYILILLAGWLTLAAAFTAFNRVLADYYTNIVRWVTLPLP